MLRAQVVAARFSTQPASSKPFSPDSAFVGVCVEWNESWPLSRKRTRVEIAVAELPFPEAVTIHYTRVHTSKESAHE